MDESAECLQTEQIVMTSFVKNIVAGIIFVFFGTAFLLMSLAFPVGNIANMGPGFFPAMISIGLIIIGVISLIKSRKQWSS
jgi:hypothetical protein